MSQEVDLVICARVADAMGGFTDNVETVCTLCGAAIVHRPDVPKKPPKICWACAQHMAALINAKPQGNA